ncbi:hypothetical protein A2565_00790 [Candidatus Nomurabacteria bacterium RIFOXYD1_FULL_36_19]|nr:MAG: hypothetical protein A2565_00790 [Candidatus Nomurabacteria bacterium RIFOXYD1_FULL_36_19]
MKNINFKNFSILMFTFVLAVGGLVANIKTVSATNATLSSQNFIVWNQGNVKGYDVGFSIKDAKFDDASSIVIKLYSGSTLLQTNRAVSGKIKGSEFITPFDVLGSFNYTADGYFTNTRESEYGKNLIPSKVVAEVTLNNGQILSVTNSNLSGDTRIITSPGSVLGATKFHFTQPMKNGSKGNEVIELQKLLNASGYNCGEADGFFGPKTKGAVIKFQLANSLKGDGLVGPATRATLNK